MKIVYLLLVICVTKISYAQSCIDIKYKREPINISEAEKESIEKTEYDFEKNSLKCRMLINDSFAFRYFFNDNFNPFKKNMVIGDKLLHHAIFFDYFNGVKFHEVNFPKKHKILLILDSSDKMNYKILEGTQKNILGYTCKAALATNKNADSVLVFFTTDLKFKKGDLNYNGAPGVVLEVYDQILGNIHIKAYSIEESNIKLVAPTEGIKLTLSEFISFKNKN